MDLGLEAANESLHVQIVQGLRGAVATHVKRPVFACRLGVEVGGPPPPWARRVEEPTP
jgi:hypothetical protein